MKTVKIFFLFLFITVISVCAQQKKYITYSVKKGETIKSIAKAHGLKSKDLLRLNPDVNKKPEPNTVIIIPNINFIENGEDTLDEGFHKVQKHETLFSISQKYGVTIEAIKSINNLLGNNLSVGRVIRIPAKVDEVVVVKEIDPDALTHEVIKDDTIYSLTKKYNLTKGELFRMNPELKDGLKLGMTIIVGKKSLDEKSDILMFMDTITEKPLKIVLMLPYKIGVNRIYEEEFESKNSLLNVVTDFHAGSMIAIDSLRNQGMNIQLEVVDTQNKYSKIEKVANDYNFDDVDAVIGPLFLKNAKQLSDELAGVPVVAPIYSKTQNGISEDNLVKVAPNKELIEPRMTKHLIDNYDGEKIILISDTSSKSISRTQRLKRQFEENEITDITVVKPEFGYISKDRFIEVIDTIQKKNWVVLLSDDNIVTSDVVNNLGVMPYEKRDIQLFGFNKGKNFDGVINDRLERLKYTFPAVEFKDVSSVESRNFYNMYKKKNFVRPTDFAVRGFDVTYDTLLRLSNAADFEKGAKQGVSERVYTKFDYGKRWFGSTENNGIFLLQYQKNLELISLD